MKNLLLPGICMFAWLAWIPATLLQKKARGDDGETSIVPVIPLFPLVAWLVGLGLNRLVPDLGLYAIGGMHIVLSVVFIGSATLSVARTRRR